MSGQAMHNEQVVHRTCAGCGRVSHYDGSRLDGVQLSRLQSMECEECGSTSAVLMMTQWDPSTAFALEPLPGRLNGARL